MNHYRSVYVSTCTAVYLSIGGENLPNHDYVVLDRLGNSTESALVCRTDQTTAASGGTWLNPRGGDGIGTNNMEEFYTVERSDGLFLLRGQSLPLEGLYSCSASDSSSRTKTVFVGVYSQGNGG